MNVLVGLMDEYIVKAITLTERVVEDAVDANRISSFANNRERLLSIVDHISKQIDWQSVAEESRHEISRKIDYIKKLDEKIMIKLQEHKEEARKEIERTYRQKENIKGYNLNNVK